MGQVAPRKHATAAQRKKYSEDFKLEALKLAGDVGTTRAARELDLNQSTLEGWCTQQKPKSERRKARSYSAEFKLSALELAEKLGAAKAAQELKMNVGTLDSWRLAVKPAEDRRVMRKFTADLKVEALKLVALEGTTKASQKFGVDAHTLARWRREKNPSSRPKLPTYTATLKAEALELAERVGSTEAALTLGMKASTIVGWRTKAKSQAQRRNYGSYTEEFRQDAVKLARRIGVSAAALELHMNPGTLDSWKTAQTPVNERRPYHQYAAEIKAVALERLQHNSVKKTAHELGVSHATLSLWRRAAGQSQVKARTYTLEFKTKACELGVKIGCAKAAVELGMPNHTLNAWIRQTKHPSEIQTHIQYSPEFKRAARDRALAIGPVHACLELGVKYETLKRWVNPGPLRRHKVYSAEVKQAAVARAQKIGYVEAAAEAGVEKRMVRAWAKLAGQLVTRTPGMHSGADKSMAWVTPQYPELAEWRDLAVEWISGEMRSIGGRLGSLRIFFVSYLVGKDLPRNNPADLLLRTAIPPDFYAAVCSKSFHGVTTCNFVHEFLEWVLLRNFSAADDFGRQVISPAFHNPVQRRSRDGMLTPQESVYATLPYAYIDELRLMLAQGPNFSSWTWASSAFGIPENMKRNAAPDWFPVSEELIDTADPDCVWRRRLRGEKSGGPVLEVWSPVRWVALLIKLILPLRTFQVRVLDSGEADTWRFEGLASGHGIDGEKAGIWKLNRGSLSEGLENRPLQQGVFRKTFLLPSSNRSDPNDILTSVVQFYINTNKTADAGKSGPAKGYIMPWYGGDQLHSDPFYWLEKLRNWQEKYNPLSRRTSWGELDGRHIDAKSEMQLAQYPDTCFLFRMPEAKSEERHLPPRLSVLDIPWYKLLRSFEERLAERGEAHADGTRIRLVIPDTDRTEFPPHSLRVSLITALALDGHLPFPMLQKLVGHSRLLMTLYYVKIGPARTQKILQDAIRQMEEGKLRGLTEFLSNADYDRLVEQAICNSKTSIAAAIPVHQASRNPAGWMPMHNGLCLVGGNTREVDGKTLGGCYNGGAKNLDGRTFAPVAGGAHNCIRCRWFVTEAHYLPALVAQFNNLMYHLDEARNACVELEAALNALKLARMNAEDRRKPFDQMESLKQAQRLWEIGIQKFNDLAEDATACFRLINRCTEVLQASPSPDNSNRTLLAVGTLVDVKTIIEETDSELLQLAGVCEGAEIYPGLEPGKAIFRRSQLLDAALYRDGVPPVFMALSENEQLRVGNEFLRALAAAQNPEDLTRGNRSVIALIDGQKSLSKHLGIDVKSCLNNLPALSIGQVRTLKGDTDGKG